MFGSFDEQTFAYQLPRELRLSMMDSQLHCLSVFVTLVTDCKQRIITDPAGSVVMCRGSNVKDSAVTHFQLESLILAQNERWRQA